MLRLKTHNVTVKMTVLAKDLVQSADFRKVELESSADESFVALLQKAGISLIATLRPGAIACFGAADNQLTVSCTPTSQHLGIATEGSRLAIGGRREITIFAASTRLAHHLPGREGQYDVVYVPVTVFRTGECMAHDMALDGPSVVFINTQFSCLSRADAFSNFVPLWQPPFISHLMPEDRCHLNSFAIDGKRIRYATAFAPSNSVAGYRTMAHNSGIIIDVEANVIVTSGLIKPHSVRVFDDELYVLNSAAGEVLRVDLQTKSAHILATLPGFTRGLRLHGEVLFVGLSTLRASAIALNLPISAKSDTLFSGIVALDRKSGNILGTLQLSKDTEELFDFVVVSGVSRPLVLDPSPDATSVGIETPAGSFWMAANTDLRKDTR